MRLDEINRSDETELFKVMLDKLLDKQKSVQVWFATHAAYMKSSEDTSTIPPKELMPIDDEFVWRYSGELLAARFSDKIDCIFITYARPGDKRSFSEIESHLIENKQAYLKKHGDGWRLFIDRWHKNPVQP